jgi:hypothetical protein
MKGERKKVFDTRTIALLNRIASTRRNGGAATQSNPQQQGLGFYSVDGRKIDVRGSAFDLRFMSRP